MTTKELQRFLRFQAEQGGIYPSAVAMGVLRITKQGLHQSANRGLLKYVIIRNRRYYGVKSVTDYRWYHSKKYGDNSF